MLHLLEILWKQILFPLLLLQSWQKVYECAVSDCSATRDGWKWGQGFGINGNSLTEHRGRIQGWSGPPRTGKMNGSWHYLPIPAIWILEFGESLLREGINHKCTCQHPYTVIMSSLFILGGFGSGPLKMLTSMDAKVPYIKQHSDYK